jgi:hypothetical protein
MDAPPWTPLADGIVIKAKPEDGVWQKAFDYVQGPVVLRITATGTWGYSKFVTNRCTANGDLLSPLDTKGCVHEKAPVGALIGRIGGSIATKEPDGVFVVGSIYVRKLDQNTAGPLFLTINDKWNGFGDNDGELVVKIESAEDHATSGA